MKLEKSKHSVLIIVILLFAILLLHTYLNPFLIWDECAFLANARELVSSSNYNEPFKFPLLSYLVAGLWMITGESIIFARLLSIFITVGSVLVAHLIFKEEFGKKSILPTLAFALNPLLLKWGYVVYADVLAMLLIMLSYYFIKKEKHYISGLFVGLAILARFPAGLFAIAVIIYLIIKKDKRVIYFGLGITTPLSVWVIRNMIIFGSPLWDLLEYGRIYDTYGLMKSPFVFLQFLFLSLGILPLFLINSKKYFKKKNLLVFIYLGISMIYYLFLTNYKDERYILPLLPFLMLIIWVGIYNTKRKFITIALVSVIFLATSFIIFTAISGECSSNSALSKSVDYMNLRADPGTAIVSNSWVFFGYYGNFEAHYLWTDNLDMIIEAHNPDYIIVVNKGLKENINLSFIENDNRFLLEKTFNDDCNWNWKGNGEVNVYRLITYRKD